MTSAQSQILELFRALSPDEKESLLPQLAESVIDVGVYDDLSAEEIAAIEEGIAQAERGETIDGDELFDNLAKKFGFSRV